MREAVRRKLRAYHVDRVWPLLSSALRLPRSAAVLPLWVDAECAALLDAIASQASPAERRFLYRFFATVWEWVSWN